MSDLIDRQAAIDRINKQREHLEPDVYPQDKIGDAAYKICAEFIERLPSAQPEITLESAIDYLHSIGWMQEHDRVLTERKTGRWTPIQSLFRTLGICSVCHNVSGNEYEYCPWCGAKMEVADGE